MTQSYGLFALSTRLDQAGRSCAAPAGSLTRSFRMRSITCRAWLNRKPITCVTVDTGYIAGRVPGSAVLAIASKRYLLVKL